MPLWAPRYLLIRSTIQPLAHQTPESDPMPQEKLIRQILEEPETVLERMDLEYVDDKNFPIKRIRRGKGFSYTLGKGPLKNKKHLKRIDELAIPPAWSRVKITERPQGHLQAVGWDAKNRKQYRYHPLWSKIRNQTKFHKMPSFAKQLPSIRKQVDRDLKLKGWPREKVLALIIKLMEETQIRIGNQQYAKINKSYGLSTLRKKHVDIHRGKMKFEFVGKKGQSHTVSIRNKKLIRLINRCMDLPGWELFQFIDTQGNKQSVNSSMINQYLHELTGAGFTAKDFRTWGASVIFFNALLELGTAEEESEIHQNLLTAFDAAANALGNTRNVCRKYYVHPFLVSSYSDGSIQRQFEALEDHSPESPDLSPSEKALLKTLRGHPSEALGS